MILIPLMVPASIGEGLDRPSPNRRASDQRVAVVPRHPTLGARRKRVGVLLQFGQVVERVGLVQLAGIDQAHEQIADMVRREARDPAHDYQETQYRRSAEIAVGAISITA